MKKLPQKANIIQKKGYKHVIGGYGWDLGNLVFDKRVRVNGKEIKDEGNLEKYC